MTFLGFYSRPARLINKNAINLYQSFPVLFPDDLSGLKEPLRSRKENV